MKVELAKEHTINGTTHKAGTVLDLPISKDTADAWQQRGIIVKPEAVGQKPEAGPVKKP